MQSSSSKSSSLQSSPVAELVGEFDHGLEGGRWSPDGEVLALLTYVDDDDEYDDDEYHNDDGNDENKVSDDGKSGGGMMTMNARFEVLSEVSVEPNVPSSPSSSSSSPSSSRNVSLSWRPNGSALVLSTVDASDLVRRIRTYSRLDLSTLSGYGEGR